MAMQDHGKTMHDDDKEYDGIRYRPNDSPPLVFKLLYYGLWVWGLCFMGYFLFSGWSSHGEYASIKLAKESRLAAQNLQVAKPAEVSTNDEQRTARLVGEGKALFPTHCASCHGANAKGGIGPDLTSKQFKYGRTAPDVTRSIVEGRPGGMPAFQGQLSKDQIEGLAQYVLSL
jgi:cytochrome c oxidase cbb3-type subunit 3